MLTEEEKEPIWEYFDLVNADGTGTIGVQELKVAMREGTGLGVQERRFQENGK